jgi:hypothetical protein
MDNKTEKFQYMIFIFGNFKNDDELVRLIATQISPFTNKDSYLKYNYGDYGIVMNLESLLPFYEIRDYIHLVLEKVAPQYFLIERPQHMYAFMPPELKLNLFDLNEENDNVEQKDFNFKDMTDIIDNFLLNAASTILPENVLPEEKMNEMFENIMTKVNEEKPSMDDILEKIKEEGMTSLTKTEKQILDEYSKT